MFQILSNSYIRPSINKFHVYHLLSPSIWPLVVSGGIFSLVISLISSFYVGCVSGYERAGIELVPYAIDSSLFFSVFILGFISFCWWSDVSAESGEHTKYTIKGLKVGMALFIVSEVMFFFSFFWTFFHVSLSPPVEVGSIWPPVGFKAMVLSYQKVPLLNTLLLLASGISVTYAHSAFHSNFYYEESVVTGINKSVFLESVNYLLILCDRCVFDCQRFFYQFSIGRYNSLIALCRGINGMWITLIFAFLFILLQASEYLEAVFNISDGTYGSTFFVMTGFHGLHVIVGTIFLAVCLYRICNEKFFFKSSTGLECAIWYWHFVDVVWLFLYISIYWWGNIYFKDSFFLSSYFNFELYSADAVFKDFGTFQDPATNFMEEVIILYNYVYLYLVFISFILLFILIVILE